MKLQEERNLLTAKELGGAEGVDAILA